MCTVILPPSDNPVAVNKYIRFKLYKGESEYIYIYISTNIIGTVANWMIIMTLLYILI
jgi:hypothetical protein